MSVRLLNKIIDTLNRSGVINKHQDIMLHFLNEAIIHKNPKLFIRNFVKYELARSIQGGKHVRRKRTRI